MVKTKTLATLTKLRVRRWQQRFLRSLRTTPNVTIACRAANVSRQSAYRSRGDDPAFAEKWQSALDKSIDALETRAFKLALEGDPHLLQFMLRAHRKEVYGETSRVELDARFCGIVVVPPKEDKAP
jgi:hypothetical protein